MKKNIFWLTRRLVAIASIVLLAVGFSMSNIHADSHMRTPIDYHKSSETIPYPSSKVTHSKNFWINVKISKCRAYLMEGNKPVYTMYCSAGKLENKNGKKVSATPTGTYHIQQEHGKTFYNPSAKSGGNYYRSWNGHGAYLFHSTPIDKQGNYIKSEAQKLGKEPASHGCIRLTIADAHWFYQHIPVGTKVVVDK